MCEYVYQPPNKQINKPFNSAIKINANILIYSKVINRGFQYF